jgi:hypothetical protein
MDFTDLYPGAPTNSFRDAKCSFFPSHKLYFWRNIFRDPRRPDFESCVPYPAWIYGGSYICTAFRYLWVTLTHRSKFLSAHVFVESYFANYPPPPSSRWYDLRDLEGCPGFSLRKSGIPKRVTVTNCCSKWGDLGKPQCTRLSTLYTVLNYENFTTPQILVLSGVCEHGIKASGSIKGS